MPLGLLELIHRQRVVPVEAVVLECPAARVALAAGRLEPDRADLKVAHKLLVALRTALGEAVAAELRHQPPRVARAEVQAVAVRPDGDRVLSYLRKLRGFAFASPSSS